MATNPFEAIELRLSGIEQSLKHVISFLESNDFNKEDIIDAVEAAKILHITVDALYFKTHKRLVPYYKADKSKGLLFSRKRLHEYILEGEVKTIKEEMRESQSYLIKSKRA
jgi:hypothetical protein